MLLYAFWDYFERRGVSKKIIASAMSYIVPTLQPFFPRFQGMLMQSDTVTCGVQIPHFYFSHLVAF